uniref:Nucleotid_trans domain-containing protein n=1 Tax=Strongyloides venezuelensis TaxID=75913 RepID=A0A0K0FBE7_STRVS
MTKSFDPSLYGYLKQLNILNDNYPNVTSKERENPIFVTSVSDPFIPRVIVLLESIIKNFPKSKIIVYDLGLKKSNIHKVKKVCSVIYRKFKFENYPNHVSNLKTYAFKALIIAEVLRDFKALWYLDSSLTFTNSHLKNVYTTMESKKSPYILHDNSNHGIIRATVNETFDYLPSNTTKLLEDKVPMYQAGFIYVVRNYELMKKVLKWYVLCSLEENCISPKYSVRKCIDILKSPYSKNIGRCHRQDQSVINIILWNNYNGTIKEYTSGYNNFYRIKRNQKGKWKSLKFCRR